MQAGKFKSINDFTWTFLIIFLDDDPLGALVYFSPSWVSDSQKLMLCGQLVGMMDFCETFEEIEFISLMNGKFKFEKIGKRFVMAVGSDRNLQESILSHRCETMREIIKIYHNDLFNQIEDRKKFSEKIYQIFETFLPVVQHNSMTIQNVYKLHLPKSASNLYLTANQILENIITNKGIIGGLIMYNSKIVCSQFSSTLSKILVQTDPHRIKTTAEIAKNINFHIPTGSQIIKIFITLNEYNRLQEKAKKISNASSLSVQSNLTLPFSIKKKPKEQRRDKLIFSHIPEEEPLIVEATKSKRPNHLPLKLKTVPPESGIVSFDETDSYPDFIGKVTVAQTPLAIQTPLVGPISSIFAVPQNPVSEEVKKKVEIKEWKPIFINYVENPFKVVIKKSFDDLPSLEVVETFDNYNTITDPLYPIIGAHKKKPISKSLFDEFQELFTPPKALNSTNDELKIIERPKPKFENDPMIMKRMENKSSPNRVIRNQKKKMLKLPIKSFSLDKETEPSSNGQNSNIFDSPSTKRKLGLQLTPLMSKLTLLAMADNENFSRVLDETPIHETPADNKNIFNRLTKVDEENQNLENLNEMKRVDLFVHGEKNLTLMIIADENLFDQKMVQKMFDICLNRLSRLEQRLNDLINVTYDLKANNYSFVALDKNWDVMQRSGIISDLPTTSLMHDQFEQNDKLTDIVIRTNDSIIYGHNNLGMTKTFYQHPAKVQSGFPAPSEFTIISSAKRTLERDQSLVLF